MGHHNIFTELHRFLISYNADTHGHQQKQDRALLACRVINFYSDVMWQRVADKKKCILNAGDLQEMPAMYL